MFSNEQVLYVGEFRHQLDAKGRLTIPSKWRFQGDEADVYMALPNAAGFVTVYPPARMQLLEQQLREISLADRAAQMRMTGLLSMAHRFGCDKQGRINLNEKLIRFAGIEKECVLLGGLSVFSIYSPAVYDGMVPKTADEMGELFKQFKL